MPESGPPAERRYRELALAAGGVDCWSVPLRRFPAEARPVAVALLSAEERERAARFHFDEHREEYTRSHAALRILLARYLGVEADSLVIAPDGSGRPVLAKPARHLHFNLSHSGETALVALASAAPVGIDAEIVRDFPDLLEIAMRYFAPREVADLRRLDAARRREAFYVTWTRKEAFVKALGLGLSYPLDTFCTGPQDRPPRLTRARGAPYPDWTMADLKLGKGYKGAVAIRLPNATVRLQEATWPWLLERLRYF